MTIDFFLVGTSRSGTTMTQRLLMELVDVSVPVETHYFSEILPAMSRRGWSFPLEQSQIEMIPEVARIDDLRSDRLDGTSRAALLESIVAQLTDPSTIRGEKTPLHLRWWKPILRTWPAVRLIGVVRHPCAVAASHRRVPWGTTSPIDFSTRWVWDQRQLRAAARAHPERVLVVRYEDIVAEPDRWRDQMTRFLHVRSDRRRDDVDESSLRTSEEWWKQSATGPITTSRVNSWRHTLPSRDQRLILHLCAREMQKFGYTASATGRPRTVAHRAVLAQRVTRLRAAQYQIDRVSLT